MTTIKAVEAKSKKIDEIGKRGTASVTERVNMDRARNGVTKEQLEREKQELADKIMGKDKPQDKRFNLGR